MLVLIPTGEGSLGYCRCWAGQISHIVSQQSHTYLPPFYWQKDNPWGLGFDIVLEDCHCSARLSWTWRVWVSLQTPYCFTALLFLTAGAWSEWSVAGHSTREVLCGYVHCGCRYSHRIGPGNQLVLQHLWLSSITAILVSGFKLLMIQMFCKISWLLEQTQVSSRWDRMNCHILTSEQSWIRCTLRQQQSLWSCQGCQVAPMWTACWVFNPLEVFT